MDKIEWCDPPDDARAKFKGVTQRFVEELKKRPGAWAKYPGKCTNNTAATCKARFQGTEWTQRKVAAGEYEIYARWVGP